MQRPLLLAIDGPSTPIELLAHSARAMKSGFDGIECHLRTASKQDQPANSQPESIHVRAVAMRCELIDIHSAFESVSSHLQEVASLGATVLNLNIPPMRQGNESKGFAGYQDGLNFAYELLHKLRFEAKASGVAVALEAASGGCLLSPIELREMIDAVNSSAVGVCIDIERIASFGSPINWIHTLHRRIQAVRYANVPCADENGVVQTGRVRIDSLIQALDDVRLDCPLILSGCDAGSGVPETLRRLICGEFRPNH